MKVTAKMLNGYIKAEKELYGICQNDAYNKTAYGITLAEHSAIARVVWNYSAFTKKIPSLNYINNELKKGEQ